MKRGLARYVFALALCFSGLARLSAQDPQYSQFYSNLVLLNPAFTGSGIGPRIAMNYRAQWVKIPGYYKQFAFSYDQPVHFLGTTQGLGVSFASDVAGEGNLTKLGVSLNYAYQIDITDEHTLRFGLSGGFQQASIDFYKLRFPDQIDPRGGFVDPTQEPGPAGGLSQSNIRPDISAGVTYFNQYAWIGLTVNHITEPEERFYNIGTPVGVDARLPRKFTVTGGIRIPIETGNRRREVSITPAFLYKMQGDFYQIDAGMYVNLDPMVFGFWYRHQDAVIGLIGLKTGPFSFGYSYDYTISDLTQSVSGGSHEVALVLEFEQPRRRVKRKHRRLPCPRF
ncbi:MAG: type IX secretion system membrane protein PorP/SprF [Bacteroidetes bacterium]|nr:MAG: type IX secretion system membrane protein PorP/SprF [Bacteroidota bacterium]